MKKILFCVLSLTLLLGCGQSKKFIPEKTLVSIVKDIYISNSYANNFQPDLLSDTVNYYEPILKKYGYTFDDFRYTFYKMSLRKSSRVSWIVSAAIDSLNRQFAGLKYYKKMYETIERGFIEENRDTILVRNDSIYVDGKKNISNGNFSFDIDTNRVYKIKFRYKIDTVDTRLSMRCRIATYDKRDKLLATNIKHYTRGGFEELEIELPIKNPEEKSVKVDILYFGNDSKIPYIKMQIDSLVVSRTRDYFSSRELSMSKRLNTDIIKRVENAPHQADSSTIGIMPPYAPDSVRRADI
ncbi:MAG: DUF4296 domain-containing protein [Rikenellaceae bacterium]|nr:DUF4296 domain-containing protein [Rikenellaceae bacterium]